MKLVAPPIVLFVQSPSGPNRFINLALGRGECEYDVNFAVPFPSSIFLELMGPPWEEIEVLLRLKDGILRPRTASEDLETRVRITQESAKRFTTTSPASSKRAISSFATTSLRTFCAQRVDGARLTSENILDMGFPGRETMIEPWVTTTSITPNE